MGTANYDFTYIAPNEEIDIAGNTARFLDEIDADMENCSFSLHGKTAVFLGDSITYGSATAAGGQVATTWPQQFGNVTGCSVTNIAVAGATAASYAGAPSTAAAQAQSLSEAYDYAFLMFGTNDYGHQVQPGSTDIATDGSTVKGIFDAVTIITGRFPNTKVIGIIPMYMPGDFTANGIGFTAMDYKSAAYQAYTAMNVPVIDLTHGMGYNANNWNSHLMPWDIGLTNLHPNQETYIEMGTYIAKALSVNSFGGYTFNRRNKAAWIPTAYAPHVTTQGGQPPIVWRDRFTGGMAIDFGEGLNLASGFTGPLFAIDKSAVVSFPYRNYYFPASLLKSDSTIAPALVCVNPEGGVSTIGIVPAGSRIYGSAIIPADYFNDSL